MAKQKNKQTSSPTIIVEDIKEKTVASIQTTLHKNWAYLFIFISAFLVYSSSLQNKYA